MEYNMVSRIDIIGSNGGTGLHYPRLCNMCGLEKPLEEFHYSSKKGSNGRQYHCKKCATLYKQKNKDKVKETTKKNHQKDYRLGLIRAAKHRAKIKGIPFNIEKEDLELITICPVLQIPIYSGELNNDNSPSIDRVIPSLGYIKGNVHIISKRANTLKGDGTIKEHLAIINYISKALKNE